MYQVQGRDAHGIWSAEYLSPDLYDVNYPTHDEAEWSLDIWASDGDIPYADLRIVELED